MNNLDGFSAFSDALMRSGIECSPATPARSEGDGLLRGVVRPADTEALQHVVRQARDHCVSLVVRSSQGASHRDGTHSGVPHVRVDLSHWKRIDMIDRRNRVCRIEPGVTFDELNRALAPHGLVAPVPLAPRAGKSVVASVMDREPHIWPNKQWDISDPVGSTELVLGTGDRFRTGAAGAPGSLHRQRQMGGAQKCSSGPGQMDLHRLVQGAQGSFAIVTWITLRCEVKPAVEKTFLVASDRLAPLVAMAYGVQRPWLGEEMCVLDRNAIALLFAAQDPARAAGLRRDLPRFVMLQNIAGFRHAPQARVAYQQRDIAALAARESLGLEPAVGSLPAAELLARVRDGSRPLAWQQAAGPAINLFFQTTLDKSEHFIDVARGVLDAAAVASPLAIYLQPQVQNHLCHVEFVLPADGLGVEAVAALRRRLHTALGDAGAFFSRPYGEEADAVFARNPGQWALLGKMKSVFDPDDILHRGKWGMGSRQENVA